ncbi:cation diffusion facilitator CzcD-associated flavoprotein CzcO [Caballeronia udeis]|uniref:Cation diffusion facilitator CzcD-associated flavoprotein CzcO n=1 Tax=Caballeronia udeis TaxID=1232866 RepID=A0ABW8MHA5_9BURK
MTITSNPDATALEALRLSGPDPDNWVPDRAGIDHNVVIVGGGQTGAAFAFALRRAGIGKVSVIDAATDEAGAGVWLNRARMNKLRTPKTLVGPELSIAGLSFQTWFEARWGAAAYADIDRIPRARWAEYLGWYRHFLKIPIRYGTRLARIEPVDSHFRLRLLNATGDEHVETARKVILCNGVAGNGAAQVPPVLHENLPRTLYAHTSEAIDFKALRDKTVAVIGGAASAFDAAATALEAGAAQVHLFVRRDAVPAVPITRTRAYPGAYDNYPQLPDALRWRQALRFRKAGSTPPVDAVERVTKHPNFHLHLGAAWSHASVEGGRIAARLGNEQFQFDFAIAGTGYLVDPVVRPELSAVSKDILLWRDRYVPEDHERDDYLGAHPYLGAAHEYLEKVPGTAPHLANLHVYNPAGLVSFGVPVGDVPSMKRDIPAVVSRISRDLFLADLDRHEVRLNGDVPPDFNETLYAHSVWQGEKAGIA